MPINSNSCDMMIMTGNNKGKLCKDINKYCRHHKTRCETCGETFGHKSSYLRHIKVSHPLVTKKVKIRVVKKEHEDNTRMSEMEKEIKFLKEQFSTVAERVNKVEQEPTHITVVIGDETIFMGLVKRMGGAKSATKFLLENIKHKDSINIVDKMYLEGVEKNHYPIACTDNYKFRYLNHCGDIVDDNDGVKIVSKLENEIHSALIEANTHLITEYIGSGDDRMLYNVHDIGGIQEQLGSYRGKSTQCLRDDLAKLVYNSAHPFFA